MPNANAKTLNHCHADQPQIVPDPESDCVRTIKDGKSSARESSLFLTGLIKIPLRRRLLLLRNLIITIIVSLRRCPASLIARPLNLLAFLLERRLNLWKQFDQIIELVYR